MNLQKQLSFHTRTNAEKKIEEKIRENVANWDQQEARIAAILEAVFPSP